MKRSILILLALLILTSLVYSKQTYYIWLGKSAKNLVHSIGHPAEKLKSGNGSLYVYKYQVGYRGFYVEGDIIGFINTTTYWFTLGKARNVLRYSADLYKKDGFRIMEYSDDHYLAYTTKYKVDLLVEQTQKGYSVSETVRSNQATN